MCGPLTAELVTQSHGRWFPVFIIAAAVNFVGAVIYQSHSASSQVLWLLEMHVLTTHCVNKHVMALLGDRACDCFETFCLERIIEVPQTFSSLLYILIAILNYKSCAYFIFMH